MPAEADWEAFFDADAAMARILRGGAIKGDAVEFGCGYGTFTIPAAQRTRGTLTALDIEPEMVRFVEARAARLAQVNIHAVVRDFVSEGTGLPTGSQAHAMIFNLLHIEEPVALLKEARRVVRRGGLLSVMHWRSDVPTPRGPPLDIRPSPEQCAVWLETAGFASVRTVDLAETCPFHFALVAS